MAIKGKMSDELSNRVRGFLGRIGLVSAEVNRVRDNFTIRTDPGGVVWLNIDILADDLLDAEHVALTAIKEGTIGVVGMMNLIQDFMHRSFPDLDVEVGMSWPAHVVQDRGSIAADREIGQRLANEQWVITVKPRASA